MNDHLVNLLRLLQSRDPSPTQLAAGPKAAQKRIEKTSRGGCRRLRLVFIVPIDDLFLAPLSIFKVDWEGLGAKHSDLHMARGIISSLCEAILNLLRE